MATPASIFHISNEVNMFTTKKIIIQSILADINSLPGDFNQIQ
jgi:hypothetical protein